MNAFPSSKPRFLNGGGAAVAVIVVVITSVVSTVANGAARSLPTLTVTAVLFVLAATVGLFRVERLARREGPLLVLLGVLTALGGVAVWTSTCSALLMLMPLISFAVLYQGTVAALLLTFAFTLMLVVVGEGGGFPPAAIVATAFGFIAAAAFVIVFSRLALREKLARGDVERLAAELEGANARLREYAAKVEDLATAKERNRIAREIHDSLGHYLTVVNVQIEAARAVMASDPERALSCLLRAQTLTHEGLSEVRRSVAVLRGSPTEDKPLAQVVSSLLDECRASGVVADFVVAGSPRALAEPVEFTLYRAAQEALTNVRRHARASHAALTLTYGTGDVLLSIEDDGVGSAEPQGGFGLLGLRERVQLLGGSVAIRTSAGDGFALEVRVPG